MRKRITLNLAFLVMVTPLFVFSPGCNSNTEEVTVEGRRGREKTYEVEKDRQGNVTEVKRTK